MTFLTCTRFNTDTLAQNERWRDKNKWVGCIYGTPKLMRESIPIGARVIVLEMHNDLNKLIGIGLIKNRLSFDKKYKIYDWGNYNRYTYKGCYRIDRADLSKKEEVLFYILDALMFKGKTHLKRAQGITLMPDIFINNIHIDFINKLFKMFIRRYKGTSRIDG